MKSDLNSYLSTPIGEQIIPHLRHRAELRRTVALFPFSLSALFGRNDEHKSSTMTSQEPVCHGS